MRSASIPLDMDLCAAASDLLARHMHGHVADILERDGLPHYCHLLNGWGNARYQNRTLLEHLDKFTQRDRNGRPALLQCDPEGDFHPWQTFAYAVMAGVDWEEPIAGAGASLAAIARNSRRLNTGEGRELGHLLFALAYLEPDIAAAPFEFGARACSGPELMEAAFIAHHFGSFEVCRKFHLTEGLCAMAARLPDLQSYRAHAQGFLIGQLDMLLLLALILQETSRLAAADPGGNYSFLQELRSTLVLGNCIENHFYYAGHAIELAGLAHMLGYKILPEQWNTMAYVANELNLLLPTYLPHTVFGDSFLHFGHYRRAITLLVQTIHGRQQQRFLSYPELAAFTVDFDRLNGSPAQSLSGPTAPIRRDLFELAQASRQPRPAFEEIVARYAQAAPPGLEPRGKFDHFRRIGPPTWPRAFHYEFLDYGGAVGVEIHLENTATRPLREHVKASTSRLAARFPQQTVRWDDTWYRGCGRLCVFFDERASPAAVAAAMGTVVAETFTDFDGLARELAAA